MSSIPHISISRGVFLRVLLAVTLCSTVAAVFALVSAPCRHWCIVPITISGILMAVDALKWFSRDTDAFDPVPLVGLVGFNAFFLAPLLFLAGERQLAFLSERLDWSEWLGRVAILHAIGIVCYQLARYFVPFWRRLRPERTLWTVAPNYRVVYISAMVAAVALQFLVYFMMGGVSGYLHSAERDVDPQPMAGMGYLLIFADPLPLLLTMYTAVRWRLKGYRPSEAIVLGWTLAMLALLIVFGGLRGSRASTIWSLILIVMTLHYYVRPISKRLLIVLVVIGMMFSQFYTLYKYGGIEAFQAIASSEQGATGALHSYEEMTAGVDDMLVDDCSRFPLQAYLLWRMTRGPRYEYARGQTYLASLLLPIPRPIRPHVKSNVEAGTNCLYGPEAWLPDAAQGEFRSSRIYGLAGEAMLNFGVVGVPIAFALFGVFIKQVAGYIGRMPPGDSRRLMLGALIPLCVLLWLSDVDNAVWYIAKYCALALLVLVATSTIYRRRSCA